MLFETDMKYGEKEYKLDKKYIDAENKSFWFPPGIFEVRELINTLKSVSAENVKSDVIAVDVIMKSVMTTHSTKDEFLNFIERPFSI